MPADVSDRYDEAAKTFDQDIDLAETLMGIGRLRRRLARRAHGDVLEVSAGTGRNLDYYPWDQCRRLLFVDKSRPMLQQARDRFVSTYIRSLSWWSASVDGRLMGRNGDQS